MTDETGPLPDNCVLAASTNCFPFTSLAFSPRGRSGRLPEPPQKHRDNLPAREHVHSRLLLLVGGQIPLPEQHTRKRELASKYNGNIFFPFSL